MSEARHGMEHRWGTRVRVQAPAAVRDSTGLFATATVRNASLSGAFLETTVRFPLLSRVSVKAVARYGEWLHGCVVRTEDDGFAVEWLDPDLHAVAALMGVRRNLPSTSAPSRSIRRRAVEPARRLP